MREKIDCFLPCNDIESVEPIVAQLCKNKTIQHIALLVSDNIASRYSAPNHCSFIVVDSMFSTDTMLRIEENTDAEYALLCLKTTPFTLGQHALERMLRVASDSNASLVYSDYYSVVDSKRTPHPVIDYQLGSLRDDFDFGSLVLIKAEYLHKFAENSAPSFHYAGFYSLRLFLSRVGNLYHINEYLYTEEETDLRASGVKQFDYVNPALRDVQIEMEQAVTNHLKAIGAYVDGTNRLNVDFNEQDFDIEATVIIPVRNREKTIGDAVQSALSQKASFLYNVIVVDNHSTDATTSILRKLVAQYGEDKLIHIVPERDDLGIGGCWNLAVNDSRCGKFAVQLDSDDLYSSPQTLQIIVDTFYKQNVAMVIGAYRMCNFELETLPPGLIDHKEWTDENGPNNALRINGLGAPRAFFTPLLRQIQFPNTSYGEDYALGLIFSRHYRLGRIYKELYLCRRWDGNSDAALTVDKINANNLYKDRLRSLEVSARQMMLQGKDDILAESSLMRFFSRQLETWEEARNRYRDLKNIQMRELQSDGITICVQFNPARIVSTGAKIDKQNLSQRPCFLCESNRPKEQIRKLLSGKYELLVNPFPILPVHFTIPARTHRPQLIAGHYGEIHKLLGVYPELTVFYNGPKCGASAPDHAHYQAGTTGILPLQLSWQRLSRNLKCVYSLNADEGLYLINDYPCAAFVIRSRSASVDELLFDYLYQALPMQEDDTEPMMNILSWRVDDDYISVVFPRRKHRPNCYSATGDDCYLISPGALDMAGLIITPREEDYQRITFDKVHDILNEVALSQEQVDETIRRINARVKQPVKSVNKEPEVTVGIVSGEKIHFSLNKPYSAKGKTIIGEQTVEFSEGGILWNGNQYRQLTFTPKSADASFSLYDVTIGVNFHWERKETQKFVGTLRLVVESDKIIAINQLPVENYLESVISSEMSATSSLEFLKAHAVISRSWLLAQMEKRKKLTDGQNDFFSFVKKDNELIRWYDREDHTIFDVCADDHCQRYQGITKATNKSVEEAVHATKGQILMSEDSICDARFSKCCGGISEEFEYCWENIRKPYLLAVRDIKNGKNIPDLTIESEADKWIRSAPDAFCNTDDKRILNEVLNDFDQETPDFYRWKVEYTQSELSGLIAEKLKEDFGDILDLIALERGKSGRISKLKIVGSKKSFIIGKELEIRRALSESHLYSSAFVVDKKNINNGIPGSFTIIGAGWGHGVGLCQIGAAVMGEQGYKYDEILLHYYSGAEVKKLY